MKVNVMEIINLNALKDTMERYAKVKHLSYEEVEKSIGTSFEQCLNEVSSLTYKVNFKNGNLKLLDELGQEISEVWLAYPNQFIHNLSIGIERNLKQLSQVKSLQYLESNVGKLIQTMVTHKRLDSLVVECEGVSVSVSKRDLIRLDRIHRGDTLPLLVRSVSYEGESLHVYLERRSDQFLTELIKLNVPEVEEGVVRIKFIARYPGSKSFVVVDSNEMVSNPKRSLIGIGGGRILAISKNVPEKLEVLNYTNEVDIFLEQLFQDKLINLNLAKGEVRVSGETTITYPRLEMEVVNKIYNLNLRAITNES